MTALSRMAKMPFDQKRLMLKTFIESQFSYCTLVWMFCSREMNKKINHIHEKALRIVYDDYEDTFENVLNKDKSITNHSPKEYSKCCHWNVQSQKLFISVFYEQHFLPKNAQKSIKYNFSLTKCQLSKQGWIILT